MRHPTMIVLLLAACPAWAADGWRADPKVIAELERKRQDVSYREEAVPAFTLPDPLAKTDRSTLTSAKEWEAGQRQRVLDLFATHVYGKSPARPAKITFDVLSTDDAAVGGTAIHTRVKITSHDAAGKSFAFEASLLTPKAAKAPVPAFILINNRPVASADPTRAERNGFWPAEEILARGYATAVFRTGDVDPDENGDPARAKGVRGVWPDGGGRAADGDAWGTIGAWAWGASRVLDYLETVPAIDAKRVAVIGHSRGGKTALWAAAQDQRFFLAISSCSGEGGASLSRRRLGERIAHLNKSFPYWFCDNYKKFNDREDALPVDHHELIALIAPRAVAVGSADQDLWADPRGEFLAVAHAAPVFALYDQPTLAPTAMPALNDPLNRGHLHYHVRPGIHNLTPADWTMYMDFAQRVWRGQ